MSRRVAFLAAAALVAACGPATDVDGTDAAATQVSAVQASAVQVPEVWPEYNEVERDYVEPRLMEIAQTSEPEDAVLFLGDSITQAADLAALFPGVPVSNHGIAADRTQGVMARMDQITRGTPEKIVIMIGTNDLHQDGADPDAIAARTGLIIDTLGEREPQADIVLVGILPRQEDMADAVARANAGLAREAARTGAAWIDLTSVLSDETGKLRDELTYDDLHLNAEGYALWADALRPCIVGDCEGYWSRVSRIGRSAEVEGALKLGWPGSGIAFMAGSDVTLRLRDGGTTPFDLTVAGERRGLTVDEGISEIEITVPNPPARVEFTRQSEGFASGYTDLLAVQGDVAPVAEERRKILFIGDSITAGFGVNGSDEHCGFDVETSSARDAYAVLTAERLAAEAHLVAISGRGAVYNYDDNPEPNMLGHFDLALPDAQYAWDHSQWTPDAVVVSLGTNDWSTYDPGTTFAGNYTTLLHRVASAYPGAAIFAVTGPLLTDERGEAMEAGIREAVARAAKRGIAVEIVPLSLAEEGRIWGCNYHPGEGSAIAMAEDLSQAMSAHLGWSRD